MKNQIFILLFFSLSILFFSCSKDQNIIKENDIQQTQSIPSYMAAMKGEPIDQENNINIAGSAVHNTPTSIQVTGEFTTDRENLIPVESFSLNGMEIEADEVNRYSIYYSKNKDDSFPQNAEELYGQHVTIAVSNPESGNIESATLYNPNLLDFEISQAVREIDKNKGIEISWTPDTENDKPIGIALIHRGMIEGGEGVNLENIYYSTSTDDDGSHFVSANILERFPDSSKIDIILGRGNQMIFTHEEGLETVINCYNTNLLAGAFQ